MLDEWVKRQLVGEVDAESQVSGRVRLGKNSRVTRSTIRGPVVVGDNVQIENSFIGPFKGSSVIKNRGNHQAYRLMIGDDSEVLV